jgi:uncharacterized protein YggE
MENASVTVPRSGKGLLTVVATLLMLALIVWVGLLARNTARQHSYIGVPLDERNTIVVNGLGEVTAIPDIASITIGTTIDRKTVGEAQRENTRVMNDVVGVIKGFGIDEKDIKTVSYDINPRYDYVDGVSSIGGYIVSQSVSVKIRDLAKVGEVIAAAGDKGANQVGGIAFTIDEREALENEARTKAFEDAKEKAKMLADAAGVKLRRIVSFSESTGGGVPGPYYRYADAAMGMGGGGAPSIEAGSSDVISNVSVTYEIE